MYKLVNEIISILETTGGTKTKRSKVK
jgi:hypothetical protein